MNAFLLTSLTQHDTLSSKGDRNMAEAKIENVTELDDNSIFISLSVTDRFDREIGISIRLMADGSVKAEMVSDSDDVPLDKEDQERLNYLLHKDD